MKVLFLDIDGVMNSHDWFRRRESNKHTMLNDIDPAAALRVQRVCDETGAAIVVSSTWRKLHTLPELRRVFMARGITASVIDVTPNGAPGGHERGYEIQAWLDENEQLGRFEIDGMAIVDDDSDMVHLKPWLVRTPFETGIRDEHVLDLKCVMAQAMPPTKRD